MATRARKTTTRTKQTRVQKKAEALDAPREMRLSIRTSAEQKELLKRAALSRGADLSSFVLQASLEQARQAVAEESVIVLSGADYEQMCRALDEPPVPNAALRALLNRKPVWDE